MTDKVKKIREEVEKLKSQLLRGACSSQIAMETRCKEEAYDEVLAILDTMQEEPVNRTPADVESAMQEVEEKSRVFTEAHKGEDADTILAQMRGEEPVSEELEEAVNAYIGYAPEVDESSSTYGKRQAFKAGANWKKANLWKPADGDELPEIDREVVVLIKYNAQHNIHDEEYSTYRVEFGHRPNPDGWECKSVTTGKVEHYTPKTYDKGGWNIPNVKWWLDCSLPNMEED